MRKIGIILVVCLLLATGVMAAMAYTTATVTSDAALKVVNTNQALLTLEHLPQWSWQSTLGLKDQTTVIKDGELYFQFGKGVGRDGLAPVFYGLQPNSVYDFEPAFTLRNKSAETIQVTVSATGPFASYITFGTTNQSFNTTWGTQGQPLNIGNVAKETNSGMQNIRNIAVRISVPSGAAVSQDELLGAIVVEAVAVN